MNASYPRFFKYITLNITGMLGISCYILADTFFIANGIGSDGLAALNLAIPIYSFIHGFALMLGTGGATKYLIAKCQGEHHRANDIFTNGIKIGLIFSGMFIACGLFLTPTLTNFLNADNVLWDMTNIYLKVILLFSPFFIANEQLLAYVRNDGSPTLPMTAMVCGSIANIILDYIFIYPMQMGIFGAALATGIAPIVSMLILSRHIARDTCGFRLNRSHIQRKIITDTMILGFPSLVTEVSAGIVMIVFNLLVMEQAGNVGVAAYGIIANVALVTTSIFTGLSQGAQPLISEAYSTDACQALKKYIHRSILSGMILSLILYIFMYSCASPIASIFNRDAHMLLQQLSEKGIILYFTSLPFTAMNLILCGIFTAVEKPLPAHIISLLRGIFIIIPLSLMFAKHYGLTGIWLTVTATECLTAVFAILLRLRFPSTKTPSL